MVDQEIKDPETLASIEEFYTDLQQRTVVLDSESSFKFITSRSTEKTCTDIQNLCTLMEKLCQIYYIPTKGAFLRKTELSVKAFIYLICNTNFASQYLLADDVRVGHLVDIQPPFSPYLFIEILWRIRFDDLLAESILHFPLDLCNEILEVLPRCIDLLTFQRASKFLSNIVPNIYKKLILLRNNGSQTKDIAQNSKKLAGNFQELLSQFNNVKFLKLKDVPKKSDRYRRYGILLKILIQTVRMCVTSRSKKIEIPKDMENLYKLTFGWQLYEKLDDGSLHETLSEINRELFNALLKRVKEIDCNIYMNWTEHDDEDNSSMTLQRAIGLECHFFIENTRDEYGDVAEYGHLLECLQQIASKPDPENNIESMDLTDLCHGAKEGRRDCIVALFRRYKDWDDSTVDAIDSNISSLSKEDCEQLLEHLANELAQEPQEDSNSDSGGSSTEKLQTYSLCLAKALVAQDIGDLYEITIKSIMRSEDREVADAEQQQQQQQQHVVDASDFERFITHNSSFSSAKNLRAVLFYLCLNTRPTLKILLKMSIGHADYPGVAVSHDDLMLLLPILKIRTHSKNESLVESLHAKCSEREEGSKLLNEMRYLNKKRLNQYRKSPSSVSLVIRVLREICENEPAWDPNCLAWLLQMLYEFCEPAEIVGEIFIPLLRCTPDKYSTAFFKYFLVELYKLKGGYTPDCRNALIRELEIKLDYLYKSDHLWRYCREELLLLATAVLEHLFCEVEPDQPYEHLDSNYLHVLQPYPTTSAEDEPIYRLTLLEALGRFDQLRRSRMTEEDCEQLPDGATSYSFTEDFLRYVFLKCTREQFIQYGNELLDSAGEIIDCADNSKQAYCDALVRLTFETMLFCLEFPQCTAQDSLVFLVNCLKEFLPKVQIPKKDAFQKGICRSLDKHAIILRESVARTVVAPTYDYLIMAMDEHPLHLTHKLRALEMFSSKCRSYTEPLRTYAGSHTPLGLRLWLAHDLVQEVLDKQGNSEIFMRKLADYFKTEQQQRQQQQVDEEPSTTTTTTTTTATTSSITDETS
ncbi:hypothetical protein TKK_0007729 [Trichogramma kaykai]|uniref:F-box domain-containing protein n=1 Tax=Trichogramma kaykai TaxID=54128 RepID=A0ABD2X7B3_9HYME